MLKAALMDRSSTTNIYKVGRILGMTVRDYEKATPAID